MSVDKNSDMLSYVDSEPFRKILREQVLEYEVVNGRKIVSPTYALRMESVDPKLIEALTDQQAHKNELKTHLLNINVKRAILEEIALINGDVTHQSNTYLNVVKSFGFEKITHSLLSTDENKNNTVYHHPINGSLLVVNIDKESNVTKATIHAQGKITDSEMFKNITSQLHPSSDNQHYQLSVDVTELLSSKMECLFRSIKFNKNWESFSLKGNNVQSLYDIKYSLGLLNSEKSTLKHTEKPESNKKITHRTKRTLQ
jgi:hypothetical protein